MTLPDPRTRPPRSKAARWLKAAVSLGLLAVLLHRARLGAVVSHMAGARLDWGIAALGFFFLNLLAIAWRWQLLLREARVAIPLPRLLSFVLVGLFFNNFLPSGMGGDIVRAFDVARYCGDKFRAVSSIVMTRLVGLASSVPLSLVSLACVAATGGLPSALVAPLALVIAVEGLLVTLAFSGRAVGWAFRLASGRDVAAERDGRVRSALSRLHAALAYYLARRTVLLQAAAMALVSQVATVASIACLGFALGIRVSFLQYLLFTPLVGNVAMLPVSLNGLGVREGGYVVLFGSLGVPVAQCLSLSLSVFFVKAFFSLAGGLVVALRRGPGRAPAPTPDPTAEEPAAPLVFPEEPT